MQVRWTRHGQYEVTLLDHEVKQLDELTVGKSQTPAETVVSVTERGIVELLAEVVEGKAYDHEVAEAAIVCPVCGSNDVTIVTPDVPIAGQIRPEYVCDPCGHEWQGEDTNKSKCSQCSGTETIRVEGKAAMDLGISDGLYCRGCFDNGQQVWVAEIPESDDTDKGSAEVATEPSEEQLDDEASNTEDEQHVEETKAGVGGDSVLESPDE